MPSIALKTSGILLVLLALAGCSLLPAAGRPSAAQPTARAAATARPTARPAARPTPNAPAQPTARPVATAQPTARAAATVQPSARPAARPTPNAPAPAAAIDGFDALTPDQLPPEARATLDLIASGGPFRYRQDGAVFQNRERQLPRQPGGYYHEYTVETPGSPDRGARRIVTGERGEIFYTADHYATFVQVLPE